MKVILEEQKNIKEDLNDLLDTNHERRKVTPKRSL